ncbi:hypothetical protein HYV86_03465 [Candidatus Woesearchaeota archaeon]|nr:hypothetical protein [Candidatus Woesearchaeota archaeon]
MMSDPLVQLLIILYASVSIISVIGYIPTIKDLWHHKKMSINIDSYFIWTVCYGVTFLYCLFVLPDLWFGIYAGLNLLLCSVITLLGVTLHSSQKRSLKPLLSKTKKV